MPNEYRNNEIDWSYWLHMPFVTVWQACALSLQIDPNSMSRWGEHYRSGPGAPHIPGEQPNQTERETRKEYGKRVELLRQNLGDRNFFSLPTGRMDYSFNVRLLLRAPTSITMAPVRSKGFSCGIAIPPLFPDTAFPNETWKQGLLYPSDRFKGSQTAVFPARWTGSAD